VPTAIAFSRAKAALHARNFSVLPRIRSILIALATAAAAAAAATEQ